MLDCDRTDVSESMILIKLAARVSVLFVITGTSQDFRLQPKVCDCYHEKTQKSMSFDHAAVVIVRGNDYRINSWFMAKIESAV